MVFQFFRKCLLIRLLSLWVLTLNLSACLSTTTQKLAVQEFLPFNVMPAHHRIMNQVRISWEVREDVAHFCGFASRMGREQSYLTPPPRLRLLGHFESGMHHRHWACDQPCGLGA